MYLRRPHTEGRVSHNDLRAKALVGAFVEEEHRPPTDEILVNDVLRDRELTQRPEPIDPEVLEEQIVAQRQRCREASDAWEAATAEAAAFALARDVYARQAELARERCTAAQGGHQAALNALWALEARRG